MVITKGCPRCHGDLAHVSDVGDSYDSCVQCGFVQYEGAKARALHLVAQAPARPEPPKARPVAVDRDEVYRRRLRRRIAERVGATSVA